MSRNMLFLYVAVVCYINGVFSGITKAPGMQRIYAGYTATFQWSVTGSVSSYAVYNSVSGTLSANANYTLDRQNEVVTLIIRSIQLTDAGNYSLSVTVGATTEIDTSTLLFVYAPLAMTITPSQTSGGSVQQPATEGDRVELTCSGNSTSLPLEYRTKIYYKWYLSGIGQLQNISSGPAKVLNYGDLVDGYSIKDDGKTLVIASAQYRDTQQIGCYGQEQWSPQLFSSWFYIQLKYRPYITTRIPASKKFNAAVGNYVSLSFYFYAVPNLTSATNWSFINSAGYEQDLPVGTSYSNSLSPFSLQFSLASESYYGTYSITLSNIVGSTTENFKVLRPASPDTPSNVKAFPSHYLIMIFWNCMWFNGLQQTTTLQLKSVYNDSVVDSFNDIVYDSCYNSTIVGRFRNGIRPETDYEVLIWSTNSIGSSDIIKLTVKTPNEFKFFISSNNISIDGNQATVNFSATADKIAQIYVTCCILLTGSCQYYDYYNVNSTNGQIMVNNIQSGDVYVFDFMIYAGDPRSGNIYYLTMVKGVQVLRNRDTVVSLPEPDGEKVNPLLIAVIVLGVLLGVAVLALIGCIIAKIVSKRRQNTQTVNSRRVQQPRTTADTRAPQATTQRKNDSFAEDDTYETVEGDHSKNDTHYTALEGQRYN